MTSPRPAKRATLIAVLALTPALAWGGTARAVTFGPDLAPLPANNDPGATCAAQLPDFPLLGPTNRSSCMWSFFNVSTGATLGAPATGTVTAVRVKVGATTGKMRVNVIRFLFQQTGDTAHPYSAGPFFQAYGPEFTPAANSVTTVPVSIPVQADPTPAVADTKTIAAYDALALEVESSTVPIPLFASPGALSYRMYPGPTLVNFPAPSPNGIPNWTGTGAGVLMNADMTPAGGGAAPGTGQAPAPTPTPTPTPTPALAPTVRLPARAPVKGGTATIPIVCQVIDCRGTVALRPVAGAAAAKRTVTYGSARFSAKAGATAKVRVKLSAAGRSLLRRRRTAKVLAKVAFSSGGGVPASYKLTLRRG